MPTNQVPAVVDPPFDVAVGDVVIARPREQWGTTYAGSMRRGVPGVVEMVDHHGYSESVVRVRWLDGRSGASTYYARLFQHLHGSLTTEQQTLRAATLLS